MGAAFVLLLVGLGALAAGVLIGRYYVPDDRQLRRAARHGRAYMRALSHHIARDHDTVVAELRGIVEENVDDVEPYFALAAMFRGRGEHERAIRVHQALALRERDKKKLRQRALYELGLDFRAAGMPRRATRAMEEVLLEEPSHEGALRALAALYEEQARFAEAAGLQQRLARRRGEAPTPREHHLLVAAAQAALARDDLDSAREFLKQAQAAAGRRDSAHFFAAAAQLAAARGNDHGALTRLRQALVAEPGLAPHLMTALVAAAQGVVAGEARREPTAVTPAHAEAPVGAPVGSPPGATSTDELDEPSPIAGEPGPPPVAVAEPAPGVVVAALPAGQVALAPPRPAGLGVAAAVAAELAAVEAATGPRLELALLRAELASDGAERAAAQRALAAGFPDALAAKVAASRLTLGGDDGAAVRAALDGLVGEGGALAWALTGRWRCGGCGHRPPSFAWRCSQCRRWASLVIETGLAPPVAPSRERRASPRREAQLGGLLGVTPADPSLPVATLDPGLTEEELARAGTRRSLLGRVGGWVSSKWRRPPGGT
jgi:lipopolysaccharide biosynthesis regulator YciM